METTHLTLSRKPTTTEFRTTIFERSKERTVKRRLYNLAIFGIIVIAWILAITAVFPLVGIESAISATVAMLGWKIYDDHYMGITAYGVRKDKLVIADHYMVIRDVQIPYSDLKNLVIYVEEYLGMPREFFGVHHGGNNLIQFEHKGRSVSINYVIKNKEDYDKVSRLVDGIEKNPDLKQYLRKLD